MCVCACMHACMCACTLYVLEEKDKKMFRNTSTAVLYLTFYSYTERETTMGESINCNYAWVAVRHFSSQYVTKAFSFPKVTISKILADYNSHFAEHENLKETCSRASKKFPAICCLFNHRWHPTENLKNISQHLV